MGEGNPPPVNLVSNDKIIKDENFGNKFLGEGLDKIESESLKGSPENLSPTEAIKNNPLLTQVN